MTPAIVNKITFDNYKTKKRIVLYANRKVRENPFEHNGTTWKNTPEDEAGKKLMIEATAHVKLGERIFKREIELALPSRKRQVVNTENSRTDMTDFTFLIEPVDFKEVIIRKVSQLEKKFYLTEDELIEESFNLLKQKYEWTLFKTHVEIGGCITDGLAFVNSEENYKAKIIGFEAKTDKDTFDRLFNQINAYLSICDEVYLVVENKRPPPNLPFYVGIISMEGDKGKIVRYATSLKHSIDVNECWQTLLKSLNTHIGIKKTKETIRFFNTVENIKRKLIWNQFVVGYRQTYAEDYILLTSDEKKLMRSYFGEGYLL